MLSIARSNYAILLCDIFTITMGLGRKAEIRTYVIENNLLTTIKVQHS